MSLKKLFEVVSRISLLNYIKGGRMVSVEVAHKLELQAKQAEEMISSLRAELTQLQALVVTHKSTSADISTRKIEELQKENESLRKEIEEWKDRLVKAEVKNGVQQYLTPTKPVDIKVEAPSPEISKPATEKKMRDKSPGDKKKEKSPATKTEKKEKQTVEKSPGAKTDKKEKQTSVEEAPVDVGRLDLRVGKIVSVKKHPDADSLYVEEVDVGEQKPRTVVSGLVKHVPIEEMENRIVVLLCNLKPAKMRGITSEAMVMCASSPDKVEILLPPANSCPGDEVHFEGYPRKPDSVLNPKKKIFETVAPDLKTDSNKVATFKGVPFTVPGKGVVTTASLIDVNIK